MSAVPWVVGALGLALVIGLFAWGAHHDDQMAASGNNPAVTTPAGPSTTGYGTTSR